MNRGKNPKSSIPHSCVDFTLAVLGAGAAAPTVPLDGKLTPTTSTYPSRANGVSRLAAEIPTRSGVGAYTVTTSHAVPTGLFATAAVYAAGAAPTAGGLKADVISLDSAGRKLSVVVATPAGVATDLGTNDMLVFYVHAQDSNA